MDILLNEYYSTNNAGNLMYLPKIRLTRILAIGLLMIVQVEMVNAGSWQTLSPLPVPLGYIGSSNFGGKIYTFGGWYGGGSTRTNSVYEYNPNTDIWLEKTPMPTARSAASACEVDGKIYVIGGDIPIPSSSLFQRLNIVEEYDPVADTWTTKTPMLTARNNAPCSVVNGKVYVVGGRTTDSPKDNIATLEVYDPVTDSWTTKAPMHTPRSGMPPSSVVDGKIYVFGGYNHNLTPTGVLDVVEEYDPVTDSWTTKSSLPTARMSSNSVVLDGKIYVFGGYGLSNWLANVDIYDPISNSWSSFDPMSTARGNAGAELIEGSVYIIGGQGDIGPLDTVEKHVLLSNQQPVLNSIGNKSGNEGELLEFVIAAIDPDGNNLTFSAANLPVGASFDQNTATFSWTPGFNDEGIYENVEFSVSDDGEPLELDVELISITIGNVNRAPVITNPGLQEVLEDELLTFSITASDPDGDGVVVNSTGVPVGAVFDGSIFSWTPSLSQEGTYVIAFVGTDDGSPSESSEINVVITVGDNPTPLEQAEDLVDGVIDEDFPTNIENSYLANLKKVEKFIQQGKIQPAINQLNSFINKLEQDYNQGLITEAERDYFVLAASNLIDDLI